ncbi:extracellular solute-binding protein [Blautia schinkii]|nr:extracellular solute-binding protein [Blautia schinkii]
MKIKKMLSVSMAVAMTAGLLGGVNVYAAAEEPVTITFGFWGDTAEAEMKMQLAEAYMEENPNVTIEMEYTDGAGYLTKMQTWMTSNTVPDVFGLANDHFYQYKGSEQFEDLAPYIEADALDAEWDMDALKASFGEEDGKIAATPFITKTFAIAYNKDLFDQAKIDYPTDDWTVDDMLEAARAISGLTSDDGKIYGLRWGVRPTEFYRNLYGDMMYDMNTYEMKAAGNDKFKSAVSLFADSIKEGLAPDETSGAISTGGFETGLYGMQLSATWDISTFQSMIGDSFAWDVVMLPMNTEYDTRMLTTLRSNGWSMNSAAENKEACWDFIKFLSASETAAKASQNFGIPSLLSFAESDEYLNDFGGGTAYNKSAFVNMLDWTTDFNNLGAFAEVNDMVKTQYELLLADQLTIDEMIEECQTQGEAILSAAK